MEDKLTKTLSAKDLSETPELWIDWHISVPGNHFLVAMDMSFLMDSFTVFEFQGDEDHQGLSYYEEAHKMVMGMAPRSVEELNDKGF